MPRVYNFPDGTTGTNRPQDGEIFTVQGPNQTVVSIWQWDDIMDSWCRVNPPPPPVGHYAYKVQWGVPKVPCGADEDSVTVEIKLDYGPKCNCGSDRLGHPGHSDWCDKFQPNL